MRRYGFVILFLVVLITPFILRNLYGTTDSNRSAGPELVIISSHVEGIRREFGEAFSHWHEEKFGEPAHIVFLNYGGSADTLKFFRNSQETTFKNLGTYKIDLIWGGGDYLFKVQLADFLDPVSLPEETLRSAFPKPALNGIELYDTRQGKWFGTAISSFGICYNKDVGRMLGVNEPAKWNDLADARWHNWLVLADPSRSTSAASVFMVIVERAMLDAIAQGRSDDAGWADGMGQIRLIASNAKMFTDSGSEVPSIVGIGDAGAGMVIDFYGRSQVEAVGENRMAYIEPVGATALNPDPIGLV